MLHEDTGNQHAPCHPAAPGEAVQCRYKGVAAADAGGTGTVTKQNGARNDN